MAKIVFPATNLTVPVVGFGAGYRPAMIWNWLAVMSILLTTLPPPTSKFEPNFIDCMGRNLWLGILIALAVVGLPATRIIGERLPISPGGDDTAIAWHLLRIPRHERQAGWLSWIKLPVAELRFSRPYAEVRIHH